MTALLLAQFLTACAANQHPDGKMASPGFTPAQFAKTDIDRIAEAHERELQASLKLLAEKLYKRNPKEWKKGGWTKADEPLDRLFGKPHNWHFPELDGKFGTDAVKLSLKPDYAGDRVFAFIAGLGGIPIIGGNRFRPQRHVAPRRHRILARDVGFGRLLPLDPAIGIEMHGLF